MEPTVSNVRAATVRRVRVYNYFSPPDRASEHIEPVRANVCDRRAGEGDEKELGK